jgi:hypothetical protein
MTVVLPTPYEPLVDSDGKIREVWYRFFSGSALATNAASSLLSAITTASTVALTFATQADQEATTALAAIVTPSVQQYHPSAAKAWGAVVTSTGSTVATLSTGYNVNTVASTADGLLRVDLGVAFSSTNYSVVATAVPPSTGIFACGLISRDTTTFTLAHGNATTTFNCNGYSFACYGDQ